MKAANTGNRRCHIFWMKTIGKNCQREKCHKIILQKYKTTFETDPKAWLFNKSCMVPLKRMCRGRFHKLFYALC